MATTAIKIITRALRALNVLGIDETPSADMASDGMDMLNEMLGTWSNQNLMVYQLTLEAFSLVPGQSDYTYGVGGNFNSSRPATVESAYIRWNSLDYPLALVTTDQYDQIPLKTSPNQIPYAMLVDPGFPLTTIKLFPVPNDSTAQIFIESRKPFTEFTSLTTPINMPPGYDRALIKSLAIEMIPEYGGGNAALAMQAANARKWLKRTNFEPLVMELSNDLPQGRGFYDQSGNYI